jgi:hypothetical protein
MRLCGILRSLDDCSAAVHSQPNPYIRGLITSLESDTPDRRRWPASGGHPPGASREPIFGVSGSAQFAALSPRSKSGPLAGEEAGILQRDR